jgi:hypothetical protein
MTLYQAIERPLRASHGKEGVSGSSPDVGSAFAPFDGLTSRFSARDAWGEGSPSRCHLVFDSGPSRRSLTSVPGARTDIASARQPPSGSG